MAGVNWAGYQTGLTASPFQGRSFRSVSLLLGRESGRSELPGLGALFLWGTTVD